MEYVIIFVVSLVCVSAFEYLPIAKTIKAIIRLQRKSTHLILGSEIGDDLKQKFLLSYSLRLLFLTIELVAFIAIALLPFVVLILVGSWFPNSYDFAKILVSVKGIAFTTAVFLLYFLISYGGASKNSDYTFLMKLFHRLTLGSRITAEISFNVENSLFSGKSPKQPRQGGHLFISGLARSGTTALLTVLHETGKFASLTYADMPLVLAPNLWQTLDFGKRNLVKKERAHMDGIIINAISPEAFEEVFWKVFLKNDYIRKDRLLVNTVSPETLKAFQTYIELILRKNQKEGAQRYLSKNNNNILRIHPILQQFPDAHIIIPYREPLHHAMSLLNQHRHFLKIHREERFALNYMNWIGHYEFGQNHKPFFLGNETLFQRMHAYENTDINYWLLSWLNYYTYALDNFSQHCIFFSYRRFCENPDSAMERLKHQTALEDIRFNLSPFASNPRTCENVDKLILGDCERIYEKLEALR